MGLGRAGEPCPPCVACPGRDMYANWAHTACVSGRARWAMTGRRWSARREYRRQRDRLCGALLARHAPGRTLSRRADAARRAACRFGRAHWRCRRLYRCGRATRLGALPCHADGAGPVRDAPSVTRRPCGRGVQTPSPPGRSVRPPCCARPACSARRCGALLPTRFPPSFAPRFRISRLATQPRAVPHTTHLHSLPTHSVSPRNPPRRAPCRELQRRSYPRNTLTGTLSQCEAGSQCRPVPKPKISNPRFGRGVLSTASAEPLSLPTQVAPLSVLPPHMLAAFACTLASLDLHSYRPQAVSARRVHVPSAPCAPCTLLEAGRARCSSYVCVAR